VKREKKEKEERKKYLGKTVPRKERFPELTGNDLYLSERVTCRLEGGDGDERGRFVTALEKAA